MKIEKILSVVLCAVLSLCIAFCGMLTALEFTLFKEGYLARKMEKSDYFTAINNAVKVSCQGYAVDAGLNATAIDHFFTQEDLKADILVNMDARFRNVYSTTPTRFSSLVEYFENHIAWETDQQITQEQRDRLLVLQASCERVYQEATRPPFDAALSTLLQYRLVRKWGWIAFAALAAGSLTLLGWIDRSARARREYLANGVLGAALTLWVLSALLKWKLNAKSWMPEENLSQELFSKWLGGFPGALALIGLLLLVILLGCTFRYAQNRSKRRPAPSAPASSSRKIRRDQAVKSPAQPARQIYRRPNQIQK